MQRIKADQIGYFIEETKTAVFPNTEHGAYFILNISENSVAYRGTTGEKIYHEPSDEYVSIADFSELKAPGMYCIFSDEMEPSYPFSIGEGSYLPVLKDLFRMFYLQRCGMRTNKIYAKEFAHACCHATPARIYKTTQEKDVTGGWHDAGDYGRYVVAGAVTVTALLLSWQENQGLFLRNYDIEKKSTLPDFLEEIKFELDWMLKMQDEKTHGVYHKVTCETFPGFVFPQKEVAPLVLSPISATATADFTATMALAFEIYKEYDKEYANTCLGAAKLAYEALKLIPSTDGFHNPKEILTGEYADTCDLDERYWASAQLFHATGESRYHEDFKRCTEEKIYHGYGWTDVGSFANHAYLTCEHKVDQALYQKIKKEVVSYAMQILENSKKDAYHTSLAMNYVWGSNMEVANNAIALCDAYRYKKEKAFLQIAREQLHYLFGKNPMDICYVTGYGSNYPNHPHHRLSKAANKLMPGMVVGGSDMHRNNPVAKEKLQGMPPAKCYLDDIESYGTNEITIYWNSPVIYLLALLMRYAKES